MDITEIPFLEQKINLERIEKCDGFYRGISALDIPKAPPQRKEKGK